MEIKAGKFEPGLDKLCKLNETELSALRRAYASGTTRVSYDGKSVDYGSAEDLLARIRNIEIVDNLKTYDNVILRELRIFPGDRFSSARIQASQRDIFQPGCQSLDQRS